MFCIHNIKFQYTEHQIVLPLRDKYGKKGNLKGFFKENRYGMEAYRDEIILIMDATELLGTCFVL